MRSRALIPVLALAALLCAWFWRAAVFAQDAAPQLQPEQALYAELLKQGVDAFTAGDSLSARAAFERAHAIEPTARTYRGLALCDFELGHFALSIRELEAALNDSRRPLTPELRAQVLWTLERALRDVGRVHLGLPDGVTELRVDGRLEAVPDGAILLLDPGPHSLQVSFEGREPIMRQLEIENGATQNLIFASAPARQPPSAAVVSRRSELPAPALRPVAAQTAPGTPRVWSWVALGLTGAAGAATVGLAIATGEKHAAFSAQRDAYAASLAAGSGGMPPSAGLKRSGQRLELLTDVALVGSAVLGAATVMLFLLEAPSDERNESVRVSVGPGGAVLRARF